MTNTPLASASLLSLVRRVAGVFNASAAASSSSHTTLSTAGAWSLPLWSRLLFSQGTDDADEASERGSSLNNNGNGGGGREPMKPPKDPPQHELEERYGHSEDTIHKLLRNPVLYDPLRSPRHPIVLCHGLYGFDVRGPTSFPKLQMHYWNNVLSILRKRVGADVIVTSVPPTGSIVERAHDLDRTLRDKAYGRAVNFMAHSMGGLDCRYLITHIRPEEYTPLSLTSISTPHRGSPFMDWCMDNIGIGKQGKIPISMPGDQWAEPAEESPSPPNEAQPTPDKPSSSSKHSLGLTAALASMPSSLTNFLLSILDSPAYSNLSTSYLNDVFNPATPDDPRVRYFSIAGRAPSVNIWHPFWLPKMVVDAWEAGARSKARADNLAVASDDREWGNDGLVTVQSARWGEFLGTIEGCDHWEIRGARGIELDIDIPSLQSVSISMPTVSLRDWDWSHFLTAWRRDGGGAESKVETDSVDAGAALGAQVDVVDAGGRQVATAVSGAREEVGKRGADASKDGPPDADDKSPSEKLSTVFNWVAENVPTEPLTRIVHPIVGGFGNGEGSKPADVEATAQGTKRMGERNELATKEDLERFYVALSRKLYDEGL